jgi:hypothetical protein
MLSQDLLFISHHHEGRGNLTAGQAASLDSHISTYHFRSTRIIEE